MAHLIELWERKGERRSEWTPACLVCGWIGGDYTSRADAEADGERHVAGVMPPWQLEEVRVWGEP